MKRQHLFLIAGVLIVSLAFAFVKVKQKPANTVEHKGFALIELYTSEGCSSCPPADRLLAKIAQEYKDKEVYILAYHVDYWNRLGWKDQFSSHDYSERQRAYSDYLKLDGVYTPQAIVNGQTEFIGSDERKMDSAIQQSLAKNAAVDLNLNNLKIAGNKATLNYQVSNTANNNLMLAVIRKHATTQVKAGENSGRSLPHINIVQKLQAVSLKTNNGNAEISLPEGFNIKDWAIVGFVQSNRNGAILAVENATAGGKEMITLLNNHNED